MNLDRNELQFIVDICQCIAIGILIFKQARS